MAGGVVSDQAEADEDMSVKQRLVLAGGSALGEGSGMVGDMTDLQVVADAMEVAGESGFHLGCFVWGGGIVCKDQLCVKHAKFLTQSSKHEKNIKPEILY